MAELYRLESYTIFKKVKNSTKICEFRNNIGEARIDIFS